MQSREGAWPEFTLYDCDSCHQTITRPARPSLMPPGLGGYPRLSDDSLHLASVALRAMGGAGAADRLRELAHELQTASAKQGFSAATAIAAQGEGIVDGALAQAVEWKPTDGELRALLAKIQAEGAKAGLTYWEAQQRFGAAQAILATLDKADPLSGDSTKASDAAFARRLDGLYATVRSESSYRPDAFRSALGGLAGGSR
jgi:hypothetical protein